VTGALKLGMGTMMPRLFVVNALPYD